MRILVTGRDGQVARALARLAGTGLVIESLGRPELDIIDRISIDRAIGGECFNGLAIGHARRDDRSGNR